MEMIGRKVTIARLHTPIHTEGVGQFGPLVKKEGAKFATLVMTVVKEGLYVTLSETELLIPFAQIQSLTLAEETKSAKK